jgi:antitoxin HicB
MKMAQTTQIVEDYLKLPYHIVTIYDDTPGNSGWVAYVQEWKGCITQADTWEELGQMIHDAMKSWVTVALEEGYEIPLPTK